MENQKLPLILGAGLAGLACKYSLSNANLSATLIEKNSYAYGHARSYIFHNITFDEGPHISFTSNREIQNLIWSNDDAQVSPPKILNYWRGSWVAHPVITNLGSLPLEIRLRVLVSFLLRKKNRKNRNYKDWNRQNFGSYFTKNFVEHYTLKYWRTPLQELTNDWAGVRIYVPKTREVLEGFRKNKGIMAREKHQHYVSEFHYSKSGGFEKLFSVFEQEIDKNISFNSRIKNINLKDRYVVTENGSSFKYTHLFSSLPIPEFIKLLSEPIPERVKIAADRLASTSLCLVDLIYSKVPKIDCHWAYVYDPELLTTRFHFPQSFSDITYPSLPVGVQVEIYDPIAFKINDEDLIKRVSAEMIRMGIFDGLPIDAQVQRVNYANVVFNHQRVSSLETIREYLAGQEVSLIGRYGCWDYSWSDDAILSGFESASKYLSEVE